MGRKDWKEKDKRHSVFVTVRFEFYLVVDSQIGVAIGLC